MSEANGSPAVETTGRELEPHLVLIALRADDPALVDKIGHVLAVVDAIKPDTSPAVFAKPVSEITVSDVGHLAHFIEAEGYHGLNLGTVGTAVERPELLVPGR